MTSNSSTGRILEYFGRTIEELRPLGVNVATSPGMPSMSQRKLRSLSPAASLETASAATRSSGPFGRSRVESVKERLSGVSGHGAELP